jgi:hypothetical protein
MIQQPASDRTVLIRNLIEIFLREGFEVKGAREMADYPPPPIITNPTFGSMTPRRPDVIGFDPVRRRIVFGLVREHREALDTEVALEEYNLFLDQNTDLDERAAAVYVIMPGELIPEFTSMITHYIHREYWNRIIPVAAGTSVPGRKI